MSTIRTPFETIPDGATTFSVLDAGTRRLTRIWCRDDAGEPFTITHQPDTGAPWPEDHVRAKSLRPVRQMIDADRHPDFFDWATLQHGSVFRYWITCAARQLQGIRSFVRASQADELPADWSERDASGPDGGAYVLCSYTATLRQARALGAEQTALEGLGDIPGDVHFFQSVAPIEDFTGIKKESRQPTHLSRTLYEPGDLFQTDVEALADQRGKPFTEEDVLEATDLTLV